MDTLRALVEPMRRDDPGDVRDRALICLGFASGCRRSELVGLDVEDLSFGDDGLEVTIRLPGHQPAGAVTAKAGKTERSIMKQTDHRSVTVVRRYIRDVELFDDNAAAGIGL